MDGVEIVPAMMRVAHRDAGFIASMRVLVGGGREVDLSPRREGGREGSFKV